MGREENSENCSLRAQSIKRQPLGQKKKEKKRKEKDIVKIRTCQNLSFA